ncbi:hypothetical protein F2Q70_00008897 [Brassica cretica]|uniref:Uncharacterized protein n=1 Tax=Brassica cretica TaxID=69181 RepID=A0A8S9M6J9_BRACR|nr:hypothetical protein F2Q70_00008897 [Brassica cretica]
MQGTAVGRAVDLTLLRSYDELIRDDPWNEFCKMAKKLFIYSSDEVKKMSSKSSLDDEGTIINLEPDQRIANL